MCRQNPSDIKTIDFSLSTWTGYGMEERRKNRDHLYKQMVLSAVRGDVRAYSFESIEFYRQDKEIALTALTTDPTMRQYLPDTLKYDTEILAFLHTVDTGKRNLEVEQLTLRRLGGAQ